MLQKYNTWKVLRVFFDDPLEWRSLADVCRDSSLTHPAVCRHLSLLLRAKLIVKETRRQGTRVFPRYKADVESQAYRRSRIIDLLDRMQETGLIEEIVRRASPDVIVLFGSASRGEDVRGSDIDLYVQAAQRALDLRRYERVLARPIELHMSEHFRKYPEALRQNIVNGINLYGALMPYEERAAG